MRSITRSITLVLMLMIAITACNTDTIGPDPFARQHVYTLQVTPVVPACPAGKFNVQVSWVAWEYQAIFLSGERQVANVTNADLAKNSGCVYSAGDQAKVKLIPLNGIEKYLDEAFTKTITVQ